MLPVFRKLHRKLSPWLFVIVAVSAVTGVAFRAGKKWFGMDGQTGQSVMEWHTGEWLGPSLSPFYVLAAGSALLCLALLAALLNVCVCKDPSVGMRWVDGAVGNKGLREPVGPESEVHFVPAMTGGS